MSFASKVILAVALSTPLVLIAQQQSVALTPPMGLEQLESLREEG
jgi:hypothetical protein